LLFPECLSDGEQIHVRGGTLVTLWRRWLTLGLAVGGVLLVPTPARAGVLDASVTAPTTNTDGSQLTNLDLFRFYYSTSSSPCPGGSRLEVDAPSASPPPNQTVTAKLTGLTAGTLYFVAVTAVNASGVESACSSVASAVARIAFSVSPTGTVNFGNVNVGSSATQTFTVQNTVGGAVSGSASVSAPFSIVSGSPYTLNGSGASQVVTVRFSPTTAAVASVNVNFTGDGDSLSRLVTGTGVDTSAPTVTITSPTSASTYTTNNASVTLGGTASDNLLVTQVTWVNDRGGSGTATGTANWTASNIALQLGQNVVTVTARDAAGNTATDTLTVTLQMAFTFTDDPLTAASTGIKAVHITELRVAIDIVRVAHGLGAFTWTDPTLTPGSSMAAATHLMELRTALSQAYQAAGQAAPVYTDPTIVAGGTVIKASHLNELRAAVRNLP
jgi:hypothetical protein